MNAPAYNFAYLDEQTKRMIRRAILKAVAIPGYQVPFASREMPMPYGWGTGGVQVTAAVLGPDDVHDALSGIVQSKQLDFVLSRVHLEISHHCRDFRIGNVAIPAARGHVMVGNAKSQPRLGNISSAFFHFAERVKRAFVHVMPVDP